MMRRSSSSLARWCAPAADTTDPQPQLAVFQPLTPPRRLLFLDVVQKTPQNRRRLQIPPPRGLFLHEAPKRGFLALNRPRNKSRNPAGLLLQIAHQLQV